MLRGGSRGDATYGRQWGSFCGHVGGSSFHSIVHVATWVALLWPRGWLFVLWPRGWLFCGHVGGRCTLFLVDPQLLLAWIESGCFPFVESLAATQGRESALPRDIVRDMPAAAASSPAEVADGRVVLPILESQRDDVASIVDLEPSFGYFEDPMGRVNGCVSYGPSEEELAAERRRRRARAHQRHVDRSRSRDRNRATSSASYSWFPARASSVGEAFRNALAGRPRHAGTAVVNMQDDERISFDAALRVCRSQMSSILRRNVAFYIGITEDPPRRFADHCDHMEWERMIILVQASTSSTTGSLERALLAEFGTCFMCINIGPGGERASAGSPHFLYVLVAQDGPLRRPRR